MFVWAPIPESFLTWARWSSPSSCCRRPRSRSRPGIGFGADGDGYVRFELIENEHRSRQAIRGIRRALGKVGTGQNPAARLSNSRSRQHGGKNFGLWISDCGFRIPHSAIHNGLRAKPALRGKGMEATGSTRADRLLGTIGTGVIKLLQLQPGADPHALGGDAACGAHRRHRFGGRDRGVRVDPEAADRQCRGAHRRPAGSTWSSS